MRRESRSLFPAIVVMIAIICPSFSVAQAAKKSSTLHTYYPSPYGEYTSLKSEDLSLGYSATQPGILTFIGDDTAPTAPAGSIYYNNRPGFERFQYTTDGTNWKDFISGYEGASTQIVTQHLGFNGCVMDNGRVSQQFSITVPGAVVGDRVILQPPATWTTCRDCHGDNNIHLTQGFSAWVSELNIVKVTFFRTPRTRGSGRCGVVRGADWRIILIKQTPLP